MTDNPQATDPAAQDARPDQPPQGDPPRPDGPAAEVEEVARQRDEYFEQLQRTRADFVNFQKRSRAQAEIDRTYAVGGLASDLLSVLDNFERALQAARSSGADSIVEGLEIVYKQMLEVLARHGVEPIEAQGQPFSPDWHEAVAQQPSAEYPEGTVVAEYGRGYKLRDRVLRPSKVVVSVQPPQG
jgi:molecular chaperone GrpE